MRTFPTKRAIVTKTIRITTFMVVCGGRITKRQIGQSCTYTSRGGFEPRFGIEIGARLGLRTSRVRDRTRTRTRTKTKTRTRTKVEDKDRVKDGEEGKE